MAGSTTENMRKPAFIKKDEKDKIDAPAPATDKTDEEPDEKADEEEEYTNEQLAEEYSKLASKIAKNFKGQTGAPMVRQHLAAGNKLMAPILERMAPKKDEEETKMSDTGTNTAPVELKDNPEFIALKERQARVEAENRQLRDEARNARLQQLSEGWFPKDGKSTYHLKPGQREEVNSLLLALAEVDEQQTAAGAIKLSEGAAKGGSLVERFKKVVDSMEPHRINLTTESGRADLGDNVALSTEKQIEREARALAEKESISLHEATRRVLAKRRS